jgi:ketosteroid isomerase-like protein
MKEIEEIWRTYERTVMDSDIEGWMALWDEKGVQLPPDAPALHGPAKIRSVIGPWMAKNRATMSSIKAVIKSEETQAEGSWAFSSGSYTFRMQPKAGGKPELTDGKFLTVLRRQTDGSWKIRRDCFNSNIPR